MWRLGPRGGWNKQSQAPTFQSFIVQCGGHEPCATIEVKKLKKSFSQSDIWYLWCPISREGGHGNPLQYSSLENPMDRGAWRATVHRVAKSWKQLKWPSTAQHKDMKAECLRLLCTIISWRSFFISQNLQLRLSWLYKYSKCIAITCYKTEINLLKKIFLPNIRFTDSCNSIFMVNDGW